MISLIMPPKSQVLACRPHPWLLCRQHVCCGPELGSHGTGNAHAHCAAAHWIALLHSAVSPPLTCHLSVPAWLRSCAARIARADRADAGNACQRVRHRLQHQVARQPAVGAGCHHQRAAAAEAVHQGGYTLSQPLDLAWLDWSALAFGQLTLSGGRRCLLRVSRSPSSLPTGAAGDWLALDGRLHLLACPAPCLVTWHQWLLCPASRQLRQGLLCMLGMCCMLYSAQP